MKSMKKSKSIKLNAILNSIKQICTIIFPIITVPYVSRILGSENYGKVNYSASIISYFTIFAAFGINNYSVREGARIRNSKKEFAEFSNEIFSINLVTTVISIIGVFFVWTRFAQLHKYGLLLLVQSIPMLFNAIGADWINTIYEDYSYITIRYIIVQIVSIIFLFMFVHKSEDYIIYALITSVASAGANVFNIYYIRRYTKLKFVLNSNMLKHVVPMLILLGNSFAVTIYVSSDTTLLGILKNEVAVGVYAIATKVYLIVKQMLNAVVIVSIPRLSFYIGENETLKYNNLLSKIFNTLIIILLPAIVGLFFLSKQVVNIIAGKDYCMAYQPLAILSISLLFAVFGCFFANCVLLPNKLDKQFLTATISGGVVNFILNLLIIPKLSYNGAALTTVLAEATVMIICILCGRKYMSISINKKDFLFVILGCTSIGMICYIMRKLISSDLILTIMTILISVVIYGIIMLSSGNKEVKEIFIKLKFKLEKIVNILRKNRRQAK